MFIRRALRQISSGSSSGASSGEHNDEEGVYYALRQNRNKISRALDVVSALMPPTWFRSPDHENFGSRQELRKFCGYMEKRRRSAPRLWLRRWVEVRLDRSGSSSVISIRRDAHTATHTKEIILYRGQEDGAVEHFGMVSLAAGRGTVEFEVRGDIKLRSIARSTPPILILALAALGWPPPSLLEEEAEEEIEFEVGHQLLNQQLSSIDELPASLRSYTDDDDQDDDSARRTQPRTRGSHLERLTAKSLTVQALLLALGDVARAQELLVDNDSRRLMEEESVSIAHFGVVLVTNDQLLLEIEGGPTAPPGVASGACFYVPGGMYSSPRRLEDSGRKNFGSSDDAMDALIERAVASRVIDDFSAQRIRSLNTASEDGEIRTERVRALLNRRLRQLDTSFAAGRRRTSLSDDEEDDDYFLEDDEGNDQSGTHQQLIQAGQGIRIRNRGRWVSASLVAADEQWLTVRFHDAAGDLMNRRLRRRPSAAKYSQLKLPKEEGIRNKEYEEKYDQQEIVTEERRPSTFNRNFASKKSAVVRRRYRRELMPRGALGWAALDEPAGEETTSNTIPKARTCLAVVPDGVQSGARLIVRVPGFQFAEPCVVVVPRSAQPGTKLRFKFFPVDNGDGSLSCVHWPGFPHSELSKAPEWRRRRLDARLSALRLPLNRVSRNERIKPLVIHRDRFFGSTLAAIPPRGNRWHQPWSIRFQGEPGIDASGLSREFWTMLSETLFSPDLGLFRFASTDNLTYEISTLAFSIYGQRAAAKLYRTAGRFLAKALLDRHIVSATLSRPLLKHILGLPIAFEDLAFVDAGLYANLNWLLTCCDDNDEQQQQNYNDDNNAKIEEDRVELLCLTFTVAEEHLGIIREIELKPNGHNINVTRNNREEYVELRFKYAMLHRIEIALLPFLRGFYDVVPITTLCGQRNSPEQLDAQELEIIMFGTTNIDLDDWQRYTVYRNLAVDDPRCLFFWKVVSTHFDIHQRIRLLQFVTGTARLPAGGFKYLQGSAGLISHFELCAIDGGDLALPRAHTCFNRLDLPAYSTYERMRHVLTNIIAVDVQGFSEA